MILSYKYRITPTRAQDGALSEMLHDFCALYNAALEHRIEAYRKGVSITCNAQIVTLPVMRRDAPETHGRWSCTAQQQVLRKLDKTFKAFFGRIKREVKAGFPRFRACARYHAADFRVGDGLTLRKSGKLGFVGVPGEIKVRWHRALPSKPKPESVGIDLGLTALVALSNGETMVRPDWTKRAAKGLRRRQRALARCQRGSKIRRKRVAALAATHGRIKNRRRDFCHKLSRASKNYYQ